jgi:hypothetical protein
MARSFHDITSRTLITSITPITTSQSSPLLSASPVAGGCQRDGMAPGMGLRLSDARRVNGEAAVRPNGRCATHLST